MSDYMTLLHKHKINGGFLAPDRIPMEERNKNEMILELQNEVHTKDKEIERLKKENAILKQTMCDESLLINENALLKDIIKEVREYIYENSFDEERKEIIDELWVNEIKDILEILDKGE